MKKKKIIYLATERTGKQQMMDVMYLIIAGVSLYMTLRQLLVPQVLMSEVDWMMYKASVVTNKGVIHVESMDDRADVSGGYTLEFDEANEDGSTYTRLVLKCRGEVQKVIQKHRNRKS